MSTRDSPDRAAARLAGPAPRVLVIQAPYYGGIVAGLREGAESVLRETGAALEAVDVAGAFELPAALRMALGSGHDGYLLLGCVVKGETDHYAFICQAVCQGVMDVCTASGAAVGFGLLTVASLEQAVARSRPGKGNKGAEAAHALVQQIALRRRFGA